MRPNKPTLSPDIDLFRNRLDNMIDQRHELYRLTDLIEWHSFDAMFGELYCADNGCPAKATGHNLRLILGKLRIFCLRLLATPAGMKLGTRQVTHPSKLTTRFPSWTARIAQAGSGPQFITGRG